MRRGQRAIRTLLAVLAIVLGVGAAAVLTPAVPASAAPARGDVTVRVDDLTPSTPVPSTKARTLRIQLTLTNTSGATLKNVRVQAYRGDPIGNQTALDASLAERSPSADGLPIPGTRAVRVTLGRTPVTTTFTTTTSLANDGSSGLCLCNPQVYPIHLVARADDGTVLGTTATYVPSVPNDTAPTKVSWLWPLIDRPHRLTGDTVFTDDDLAALVSDGGRLDRALQTVEDLDDAVPITLVVDPELLDELEVMATGRYRVQADSGTTAGTGQDAARSWLDRFATVLDNTSVQISLTPYADPDTVTLAGAGLGWATTLPGAMARRVATALGGRSPAVDVAWPAGGLVTRAALDALATTGVKTVVAAASSVTPATDNGIPVDVTRLTSSTGALTGAMTSVAIQKQVAAAVSEDTGSTAALPLLDAEIAVRAIQTGSATSHAVLTPPRYVDASPERAARAIEDTSTSPFSTAVPVRDLVDDRPTTATRLRTLPASAAHLPSRLVDEARTARTQLPDVAALLRRSSDAQDLLTGLPRAVQRVTSSAWRNDPDKPFAARTGLGLSDQLADQLDTITTGVRIVPPASGSYTLGSSDSALPITVENTLPYAVNIQVDVRARDGLPGYPAKTVTRRVGANAKLTVQIPGQLERSGRIPVRAQLESPTGSALGKPVDLYIRSTVFGVIGVVITVGAGAVLVLALIVRFARRIRRLRRKAAAAKAQPPSSALATAGEPAP